MVSRTQEDGYTEHLRPFHRKVARRIAHAFSGLVGGVVFLVDNDDRQPGQEANTAAACR